MADRDTHESGPAPRPGDPVEKAAESISEGVPIPDDLAQSGDPRIDRVVENLRFIERIHQVHADPGAHDIDPAAAAAPDGGPLRPSPEYEPALFTWGHLRVLAPLGRGTSSEVYRAWDSRLQVEVALKLRRRTAFSSESKSFLDEARRMAQLPHPNLLRVYGADEHDGREGIWMDLVHGKTLKQYIAEHGVLGTDEAAVWGMQMCSALAAMHNAGLVHRDVKPSNVMRGDGGHYVLMDLGSASSHTADRLNWDDGGGTPITMAPEVVLDNQVPGPAADLYGVGVLLYWLVTGKFPIEAANWQDLEEKHRNRTITPLLNLRADAPASFVRVVERALRRRPEDRFATAGELHQALASCIGAAPLASSPPLPAAAPHPVFPARVLVPAIAALTIGAAAWLGVTLYHRATAFDPAPRLLRTSAAGIVPLADGVVVRPGDELHVELQARKSTYAWVFAEDGGDAPVVLFPNASTAANPLQDGGLQRLPAAVNSGKNDHWVVTPGERSLLVVVVCATQPVAAADSLVAALSAPPLVAGAPGPAAQSDRGLVQPGDGSRRHDAFSLDDFTQRLGTNAGVHTAKFVLRYDRPAMD